MKFNIGDTVKNKKTNKKGIVINSRWLNIFRPTFVGWKQNITIKNQDKISKYIVGEPFTFIRHAPIVLIEKIKSNEWN